MKRTLLLLGIVLVTIATQAYAFSAAPYAIYLVRHSEKQSGQPDPLLTKCGIQRAEQLATLLSGVKLEAIYSTDYRRTLATAAPSAKRLGLTVKTYSPAALQQLAKGLTEQKQTVLVVGHSNTTPMLAKLLSGQAVKPLTEQDYQQLYQIQFIDQQVSLTVFKRPLRCE